MKGETINYNEETCKLALEAMRQDYLYTERRWGYLLSKTRALMTVSGAWFAILKLQNQPNKEITFVSILFAILAILFQLLILANKNSAKVTLSPILKDEELSKPSGIIAASLAKTYHQAISETEDILNKQFKMFSWAVATLFFSIIIGITNFYFE